MSRQPEPADSDAPPSPATPFEAALAQLETIVHELEEGQIGLAQALERYELGVGLLRDCYAQLERAEQRIELLTGMDASGQPITASFDGQSTAELDASGARRTRRRNASKPARPSGLRAAEGETPVDETSGLF